LNLDSISIMNDSKMGIQIRFWGCLQFAGFAGKSHPIMLLSVCCISVD
jgi:hypothetical protein